MFRFEKELMEIGQGDLTKAIRLRQKDQITDIAVSINNMTASLHQKIHTIRDELKQIIESASNQNASESLIIELKNLDKKINESFTI